MGNPPFAPLLFLLPRVYFVSNLESKSRSDRIGNRLIPGVAGVVMMRISQVLFVVALAVVTAVPSHAMMRSRRARGMVTMENALALFGLVLVTAFGAFAISVGVKSFVELMSTSAVINARASVPTAWVRFCISERRATTDPTPRAMQRKKKSSRLQDDLISRRVRLKMNLIAFYRRDTETQRNFGGELSSRDRSFV